jgi:hypothetical protein
MKRRLAISSLTLLTFYLTLGLGFAADDKTEGETVSLPAKTIIAANWVRNGNWYALDGHAIACVKKLLEGKPYRMPEGVRDVVLPPDTNRIILWGVKGNELVQIETIAFADRIAMLSSSARPHLIETDDTAERTHLLNLLARIKEGKEKPVVQAPGTEKKAEQSNTSETPARKLRRGLIKARRSETP